MIGGTTAVDANETKDRLWVLIKPEGGFFI
jgi:hypothetical protein